MSRTALWILASSAAVLFFGWQTYRAWTGPVLPASGGTPAGTFNPPSPSVSSPGEGAAEAPYTGLSQIVSRPVFRPDRRPYREGAAEIPRRNYEAELSRFTVLGILMEGDERKAVVVSKGTGGGGRWEVGAGDELPGFTVKEVGLDGLVLAADEREFSLPLYAGGPKTPGGPVRTETAPAPSLVSPAAPPPPPATRSSPAPGLVQPPPAAGPSAAPRPYQVPGSRTQPGTPPVPSRSYPRYYIPGGR